MKCFAHQHSDAVGLCKNCQKGICSACAIDTGDGVACSDSCAALVKQVSSLLRSSAAAIRINRGGGAYVMPAFLVVLGLIFVAEPLITGRMARTGSFTLVAGSTFALFGVLLGVIQHVWRKRS
jgi:hypothetical protein